MVVPFVLERGEKRFGERVVVAASGSPHGRASRRVRLSRRPALSLCTGCLGCLEYGPFGHVSARICHLQGKDDKACPHVVLYASAHHHVCAQMVCDGKIYKACRGPAIGYVSHELGCRNKTRKAVPGEVGVLGGIRCGQRRSLGGIGSDAADAKLDHAPAHTVASRHCKFCVTLDLL
jgi:hypothetical protein